MKKRKATSKPRGGRPFGEASSSGKGMMTAYTRPSGGTKATMTFKGRKATSNGMKNLKGRSATPRRNAI